jgi:SecD/SecF fusion protein
MEFSDFASPGFVKVLLTREFNTLGINDPAFDTHGEGEEKDGRFKQITADFSSPSFSGLTDAQLNEVMTITRKEFSARPQPERLENFDAQLAAETQTKAMYAIIASWAAILLYLWFRFGSWSFGAAAVICLIHDLFFTLGMIAFCHYLVSWVPGLAGILKLEDFKIDLPAVAALLTLVGYSVNDTIVVFDRIREVRGKNPALTPQMINDSINQTLSRTILASVTTWLVVFVLYMAGGEGVHLFAFVMVVGVIVGTYSSIYIASPLLLMFGEGTPKRTSGGVPRAVPAAPATV